MILGLDVSTSFVGATVLDCDGKTVLCEAWDLRKFKGLFKKAEVISSKIAMIRIRNKIEKVYIEESLQAFRPGFSSANTLMTLAKFNGVVSWICYDLFNKKPEYISASTARRVNGIKVPRGQKAKEVVLQYLLDNEDGFDILYTTYGNPKPGSYDRADSLIIAKAGLEEWKKSLDS
tara:strand:- start:1333 stop:1860 length:528 start_codon:yes stop_codon:yes gene_type:complete